MPFVRGKTPRRVATQVSRVVFFIGKRFGNGKGPTVKYLGILCLIVVSAGLLFAQEENTQLSIATELEAIIRSEGVDEAVAAYKDFSKSDPDKYDFGVAELSELGLRLLDEGLVEESRRILELNLEVFPDSAAALRDMARFYYSNDRMDESREYFRQSLAIEEPHTIPDIILKKRLFFVPEDFVAPTRLERGLFILEPLGEKHAEMDYKAVMSSVDHLTGVLGRRDWPGELTLEEDRYALKGHEWEFASRVGFVYTVLNKDKSAVIGCVYIYPSRLDDYKSEVVFWVTKAEHDKGTDAVLFETVKEWLSEKWPFGKVVFPGREIGWGEFFTKLEEQDQKYIKQ